MAAIVLGLLVAATYGGGDFLGGLASRRRSASLVVLWSQGAGLAALVLLVPLLGGSPAGRDLGIGAAAGLVGLCGVLLLYRGLAVGRMAVVAPVTAVGAAFLSFVVGAASGEGVPLSRLAGAAVALGGVVLVSRGPPEASAEGVSDGGRGPPAAGAGSPRSELGLALGAGVAFGCVFVLLSAVGDDAGLWPVLVQRAASVPALLVVTLLAGLPRSVPRGDLRLVVATGLCDAGANVLFVLAARAGALSVVGVVSSLYPAATVLLAALVVKERISASQGLGLALAGVGVVLLAL